MGSIILDNQQFILININLEDLFQTDINAIRFVLASLGVDSLKRAAPQITSQINAFNTLSAWLLKDGQSVIWMGR